MALSVKNMLGGGSIAVKNGVEKTFFAKDGVEIDANMFVDSEYVMAEIVQDNVLDTCYDCYELYFDQINNEHVFISNSYSGGNYNYIYYVKDDVFFRSSNLSSLGYSFWYGVINNDKALGAIKLSNNRFLIYHTRETYRLSCFILDVTDSGLTLGPDLDLGIGYPMNPRDTIYISSNSLTSSCTWEVVSGKVYLFYTAYAGSGTSTCKASWYSCIALDISGNIITKSSHELLRYDGSSGGTNYTCNGGSFCSGLLRLPNGIYAANVQLVYYSSSDVQKRNTLIRINFNGSSVEASNVFLIDTNTSSLNNDSYAISNGDIFAPKGISYANYMARFRYSDGAFSELGRETTSTTFNYYYLTDERYFTLYNGDVLIHSHTSGTGSKANTYAAVYNIRNNGITYATSTGFTVGQFVKRNETSMYYRYNTVSSGRFGHNVTLASNLTFSYTDITASDTNFNRCGQLNRGIGSNLYDGYELVGYSNSLKLINYKTGAVTNIPYPYAHTYATLSNIIGYSKDKRHLLISMIDNLGSTAISPVTIAFFNVSTKVVDYRIDDAFGAYLNDPVVIATGWQNPVFYDDGFSIYVFHCRGSNTKFARAVIRIEIIDGVPFVPANRLLPSENGKACGITKNSGSDRKAITVISPIGG